MVQVLDAEPEEREVDGGSDGSVRMQRIGRVELPDPLGGDEATLVLDLKFAYHPSCRYDDRWRCPLAPAGNTIAARVEAGERL